MTTKEALAIVKRQAYQEDCKPGDVMHALDVLSTANLAERDDVIEECRVAMRAKLQTIASSPSDQWRNEGIQIAMSAVRALKGGGSK